MHKIKNKSNELMKTWHIKEYFLGKFQTMKRKIQNTEYENPQNFDFVCLLKNIRAYKYVLI